MGLKIYGIVQMLLGRRRFYMAAQTDWNPKRSDRTIATPPYFSQQNCLRILKIIEPWLLYENLLRLSRKINDVITSRFAEVEAVAWTKISEIRLDHHYKKCSIINILNIQIMILSKTRWTEKRLNDFKWGDVLGISIYCIIIFFLYMDKIIHENMF